ncbi:FimV/HubP family polar landmark protein, partial [Alteromonas sp. AMM-1]|uniref:FimV/HubP family polar landmark protein n=1 Tax=Alteromonas sp. AMM-1 TaxID=3394233 RepID=UPI0039A714A0
MKLHLTGWLLLIMLCGIVSDPVSAQTTPLRGPKNATDQYSGAVYGPIDSQDTLWRIANRYRQNQNLSIYQVMVAIYELNPDAFEQQNINLMVDGAVLKLPSDRYIARIDPVKARQKAEADDAAWARMESKPGDSLKNLKPPVPLVNQDDLTQTKSELEKQLVQIDQSQARQFEELRNQFAMSIDSVQALLDDNRKLYDRIEKINLDLESLRGRVDVEVESKVEEQLALQRELKEILLSDRAAKQAEQASSLTAMLTSPMAMIAGTALLSLSFIAGLAVWLMKRKSAPEEPGIKLPEKKKPEVDEGIADLSTAIDGGLDDNELSDEELFNDDDLLDDVLSTELESSLNDDDSFAELNDDMLVPDDHDPFEEGDSELDQDELDSLFDDEFADDPDDDAIDLSADDDLLEDFESEQQASELADFAEADDKDLAASGEDQTSDEELAALLEDPQQVYKSETDTIDSEDDIDALLAANSVNDDFDIDDIDALLDAEKASAKGSDEADFDLDSAFDEDEPDLAPAIESPANDDIDDKPEISIDDLLEANKPTAEEKASLPVDDGPVSEDMLGKLDEEISQQAQALDRLTDSIINEIEQIEMMGDLAGDLDEEELEDEFVPNSSNPQSDVESRLQSIDDLADDLDEINVDDIENADVFDDPLSDELLAELEAELPDDDDIEITPLPEPPVEDIDEENFEEDVSDDLTDELLQELGEFDSEPVSEDEADIDVDDDFTDELLDDPLTDELLAELDADLDDISESKSEDAASEFDNEELPDDALTDELLAELESVETEDEPAEMVDAGSDEVDSELPVDGEEVLEEESESELSETDDHISDDTDLHEVEEDLTKAILEELDELDRADALAEEQAIAASQVSEATHAQIDTDSEEELTGEAAFEKALADFDKQMMDDIPSFSEQTGNSASNAKDDFDDDLLGQALDDFEKELDNFELEQEQDGVLPGEQDDTERYRADID